MAMRNHEDASLNEFLKRRREIAALESAGALVEWDTYTAMPEKASAARGAVSGALASVIHDKITDPDYVALAARLHRELGGNDDAPLWQRRELQLEVDAIANAMALPSSFVGERAQLVAEAYPAWVKAKHEGDFEAMRPVLERLVEMARKECGLRNDGSYAHPYDVLLGDYEEGSSVAMYDRFFSELTGALVPFVRRITEEGRALLEPLEYRIPLDKQAAIARKLGDLMGYDATGGVTGITEHPFMAKIHDGDVRVALAFKEDDFLDGMGSAVHECGHALYSQGHPSEWEGLAIGASASFGVDESQSRMYENVVARSLEFAQTLHLNAVLIAGSHLPGEMTPARLHLEMNRVTPSLIRTESDEVTYNLHVAVRYELEKRLIEGTLEVRDLPKAWNRLMKDYLGVDVPHDGVGCLQDSHWPSGMFGYFPTYALGNVYSVQLFNAAVSENPRIPSGLSALRNPKPDDGLGLLLAWMRDRIHSKGRLYKPETLVRMATGSGAKPAAFMAYLERKYAPLYGL